MPDDARYTFGEHLRRLRRSRGLTLEQAAQFAGIARSTLNRWETNTRLPRLPELDALFNALEASPKQRRQIVAQMDAPRARHMIRQEMAQSVAGSALAPMPHVGDLLRGLRLRRGMGLEEVAGTVGVTTRTLRMWEKGEAQPPVERIHALCYVLGAYEEELIALTCGRFADAAGTFASGKAEGLDGIAARYREFSVSTDERRYGDLRELSLLAFQAQAWPHAVRSEAGRELLAELYCDHANYLSTQNRFAEIRAPAENALALLPDGPLTASYWLRSVFAYARYEVYHHANPAPERGLELLRVWLPQAKWPVFQAWMLAGMANFEAMAGRVETALTMSEHSCRIVAAAGYRGELHLRQIDRAKLLLRTDDPAAALPLLSRDTPVPRNQASLLLLRAEASLGLGDMVAAQDWLGQAASLIAGVPHSHTLQSQAEELALRF